MKKFEPVVEKIPETPFWLSAVIFSFLVCFGAAAGALVAVLFPYYSFMEHGENVSSRDRAKAIEAVETDTIGWIRLRGIAGGVLGGLAAGAGGFYVLSMKPGKPV